MLIGFNPQLLGQDAVLRPQDVFATSLYTGNGEAQTINTGINLLGEGGLVWTKNRSRASTNHILWDTVRSRVLFANLTNAETTGGWEFSATSNGYTTPNISDQNFSQPGDNFVSWNFRRAPKFFDIVTWTGIGVDGRQIPHGLGVAPGLVVVKRHDSNGDWVVWHKSATGNLYLNQSSAQNASNGLIVTADSTMFRISSILDVSSGTYVAYLFAQNPDLIDCGSYVGNGSADGTQVTCGSGWTPQYLLIKRTDAGAGWVLLDSARSLVNPRQANLNPASSSAEDPESGQLVNFTATGFQLALQGGAINTGLGNYIYMAIRAPI